jgi:hypothetical protein
MPRSLRIAQTPQNQNRGAVLIRARDRRGLDPPQAGPERSGAPDSPVPAAGGDAPISEWKCPIIISLQH